MKHRIFKKTIALLLAICLLPVIRPIHAVTEDNSTLSPAPEVQTQTAIEPAELKDSSNSAEVLSALVEGSQILTHVHEDVLRENKHVARLTQEESLSNYVFLNSDGSKTVYYMDEEVKFIDTDGTLKEKNLNLSLGRDGYSTTLNDVGLTLPTKPSSGIRLSYSGYDITLTPEDGSNLVVARQNGNSITYPDYFGTGMSLVYTPTLSGVKEDILLDRYRGVTDFTFLLETDGLGLYQSNGKYYLAAAENAEMRIDLGEVVAYDSAGHFNLGSMTVTTVTANQQYRLTLHANADFLQDANTVYPVWIDPTLSVSDNTHGINAIQDITLYSGRPNTNCNWQYLACGYYDSTYQRGRTLVRLSGLTSSSAYTSATADQIASVKFYIKEATGSATRQINLYHNFCSEDWVETTATWNSIFLTANDGSFNSDTLYATANAVSNTYTEFDITQLVKQWKTWVHSPDKGFILKVADETTPHKAFCSSEYSNSSDRPYVVFTYGNTVSVDRVNSLDWKQLVNKESLTQAMNCYGYALQIYTLDLGNASLDGFSQIPGEFAQDGVAFPVNNSTLMSFVNGTNATAALNYIEGRIYADFAALAAQNSSEWQIASTTANATVPNGWRKIALTLNLGGSFHFYFRHSDGIWSHKGRNSPISIYPQTPTNDQKILTDYNIADMILHDGFDDGTRYYLITKPAILDYPHDNGHADNCLKTSVRFTDCAGDVMSKSTTLTETSQSGRFDFSDDVDFYKFVPTVSDIYTITTSLLDSMGYDVLVEVYDDSGCILDGEVTSTESCVDVELIANSTYYIRVKEQGKRKVNYTLYYDN